MLEVAKKLASDLLDIDPDLSMAENLPLLNHLQQQKGKTPWSKIS
jgi:hypothetical protein